MRAVDRRIRTAVVLSVLSAYALLATGCHRGEDASTSTPTTAEAETLSVADAAVRARSLEPSEIRQAIALFREQMKPEFVAEQVACLRHALEVTMRSTKYIDTADRTPRVVFDTTIDHKRVLVLYVPKEGATLTAGDGSQIEHAAPLFLAYGVPDDLTEVQIRVGGDTETLALDKPISSAPCI
jgi:hypothetical protein